MNVLSFHAMTSVKLIIELFTQAILNTIALSPLACEFTYVVEVARAKKLIQPDFDGEGGFGCGYPSDSLDRLGDFCTERIMCDLRVSEESNRTSKRIIIKIKKASNVHE